METDSTDHRTQNALLTAAHRQFLPNQEDYFTGENAAQMRSEKRREIVERVRHGLLDFQILFQHLRPAELEEIFSDSDENSLSIEPAVRYNIAFLLVGLTDEMTLRTDASGPALNDDAGHISLEFEDALEDGLRIAYRRLGFLLESALLEVDSQGPIDDFEGLLQKLSEGTASKEEVLYVLQTMAHPTASVQESIHEVISEDTDIEPPV